MVYLFILYKTITLEDWETVSDGVTDADLELDTVDLGTDSSEVADGQLDPDCGEPGRTSGGVLSSNLNLSGDAAESIIFLMLCRSPGTSRHSISKKTISYQPSSLGQTSLQHSQFSLQSFRKKV